MRCWWHSRKGEEARLVPAHGAGLRVRLGGQPAGHHLAARLVRQLQRRLPQRAHLHVRTQREAPEPQLVDL